MLTPSYSCTACVGRLIDSGVHTPLQILNYHFNSSPASMFLLLSHKLILLLCIFFQEVDENESNTRGEASQPKKIGADPFNNDEADPAKSGAMRKYLLFNHIKHMLFNFFSFSSFP